MDGEGDEAGRGGGSEEGEGMGVGLGEETEGHRDAAVVAEDFDGGAVEEDAEPDAAGDGRELGGLAEAGEFSVAHGVPDRLAAKDEADLGGGAELDLGADVKEVAGDS